MRNRRGTAGSGVVPFGTSNEGVKWLRQLWPTGADRTAGVTGSGAPPAGPTGVYDQGSRPMIEVASVAVTMDLSRLGPVATLCWMDTSQGDGPREVEQEVGVDWTLLHSGGRRYWWTCPGYRCGPAGVEAFWDQHFE